MKEQFRPTPDSARKQNAPEAGAGPIGLPPPGPEQQPLPSVWDVLERKARATVEFCSHQITYEEYNHERTELNRLKEKIDKKGIDRDKHILALLFFPRPSLLSSPQQALEEHQQWRSWVELLSDEELAECARKQEEEIQAFRRGKRNQLAFHPSAGDGEVILANFLRNKQQKEK
jgi:transposase